MFRNQKIKKLIIYFIRKRLGLECYEPFRFFEQKSENTFYYFTKENIIKVSIFIKDGLKCKNEKKSNVSLNWILDEDCKIESLRSKTIYKLNNL